MKSKKKLSEYLKEKNIDINTLGKKICIVGGVGCGKNYWVENELTKSGSILLITSRKAKKDETKKQDNSDFIDFKKAYIGENQYIVLTHVKLEKFLKGEIINNDVILGKIGSLCDDIDYIVVDEAHCLISDSTYTNAAFNLWTFIEFISNYKKVILMTGTVEPILTRLNLSNFKIIDVTDECVNVKPKKIEIISKETAINIISKMKKNEKTIYMANSATAIVEKISKLLLCKGISKDKIAYCMSEDKEKELIAKKGLLDKQKMEDMYNSITEKNLLANDIDILLTTTRLKEGINILNDNIKMAFCESHISEEIIQFAGRVRNGLDVLYIIDKARQNNNNKHKEIDFKYSKEIGLKSVNEYLNNIENKDRYWGEIIASNYPNVKVKEFVDFIEDRFSYIRYNHLKNKFELYYQRHKALECNREDFLSYNSDKFNYIKNLFKNVDVIDGTKTLLEEDINCKSNVDKYIKQNVLLNKELIKTERDRILYDLTNLGIKKRDGEPYTLLASLLQQFGYDLKDKGNKKNNIKILVNKE